MKKTNVIQEDVGSTILTALIAAPIIWKTFLFGLEKTLRAFYKLKNISGHKKTAIEFMKRWDELNTSKVNVDIARIEMSGHWAKIFFRKWVAPLNVDFNKKTINFTDLPLYVPVNEEQLDMFRKLLSRSEKVTSVQSMNLNECIRKIVAGIF